MFLTISSRTTIRPMHKPVHKNDQNQTNLLYSFVLVIKRYFWYGLHIINLHRTKEKKNESKPNKEEFKSHSEIYLWSGSFLVIAGHRCVLVHWWRLFRTHSWSDRPAGVKPCTGRLGKWEIAIDKARVDLTMGLCGLYGYIPTEHQSSCTFHPYIIFVVTH